MFSSSLLSLLQMRRSIVLGTAASVLFVSMISFLQAQPQSPSIDEICNAISAQRDKLQSLDIEVATTEEHTVDPATIMKWVGRISFHNGKERFAFKGDKQRYMQQLMEQSPVKLDDQSRPEITPDMPQHIRKQQEMRQQEFDKAREAEKGPLVARNPSEAEGMTPSTGASDRASQKIKALQARPFPVTRVFNGKILRVQEVEGNGWVYAPTGKMLKHQFAFPFLQLYGMHIDDPTNTSEMNEEMRAPMLPDVLKRSTYSVAADMHDGVQCWRLDGQVKNTKEDRPGVKDRMWLDPSKGYALLKREAFDPTSGKLTARALHSDLKEVTPGCWLPMQITVEEFAPPYAPNTLANKPLSVMRFNVTRCEVNNVPDSLFEYEFPKGTILADYSHTQDFVGGKTGGPDVYREGENALEDSINTWFGKMSRFRFWLMISTGVGVSLLALFAYLWWRRGSKAEPVV